MGWKSGENDKAQEASDSSAKAGGLTNYKNLQNSIQRGVSNVRGYLFCRHRVKLGSKDEEKIAYC